MRNRIYYVLMVLSQLTLSSVVYGQTRGAGRPVASADKRLALVIGNSNYGSKPLPNASHDAQDIAKTLRSLGFEVILKENLTQEGFENVVSDFTRRLQSYAVGLFYFAGHGFEGTDNINYLMSVDVRSGLNETLTKKKSLSLNDIMGSMKESNSQTNILLVDACRNNPFRSWGRSDQKGLGSLTAPKGTIAFFAASPGEEASENLGGRNGLFTQELLVQLEEPNMELISIFKNTARAVNASNSYQTPYQAGFITNDFYFRLEAPAVAVEPPQPLPGATTNGRMEPVTTSANALSTTGRRFYELPFADLVYVPGGIFEMGSKNGVSYNERPVHQVKVSGFYMGKYEVTQELWELVMGSNPSSNTGCKSCPVEQVSWDDAQGFISKLNARTGGEVPITDRGRVGIRGARRG